MSKNRPDLVVFRLCIMGLTPTDHRTGEPMDMGFGAIVMNCKKLGRLAISGLLTDKAFYYIKQYGKLVRTLSVAFGDTDVALTYVLQGCPELQKLEIRDCPFGLIVGGCKEVARKRQQTRELPKIEEDFGQTKGEHIARLFISQLRSKFRRDLNRASAVLGFFTSACSLPFDYVKSQIQKMQPNATGKYSYNGSLDCVLKTWKAGGALKFYTEFPFYCVKIAHYVKGTEAERAIRNLYVIIAIPPPRAK
ncbi:hypothetical protein IFM89_012567 [Coptis chinensis]|uniref:Uncharacterized protein n=1 Tax=Coptis chinensis TaxID=261450 RepID=A0A835H7U4_9MAGN|nr:hypothetical protein IFM89_012567 [Coptis chinensis]